MHFFKEGYIGAANGATLFLDEIDELPLHLQIKLLGAIENKMYPPVGGNTPKEPLFRLVAATNRYLIKLCAKKSCASTFITA